MCKHIFQFGQFGHQPAFDYLDKIHFGEQCNSGASSISIWQQNVVCQQNVMWQQNISWQQTHSFTLNLDVFIHQFTIKFKLNLALSIND